MSDLDVVFQELSKDLSIEELQCMSDNVLISVYVPDADLMTRDEALELARQRDIEAAMILEEDALTEYPD